MARTKEELIKAYRSELSAWRWAAAAEPSVNYSFLREKDEAMKAIRKEYEEAYGELTREDVEYL